MSFEADCIRCGHIREGYRAHPVFMYCQACADATTRAARAENEEVQRLARRAEVTEMDWPEEIG